jgi:hypothetical protein
MTRLFLGLADLMAAAAAVGSLSASRSDGSVYVLPDSEPSVVEFHHTGLQKRTLHNPRLDVCIGSKADAAETAETTFR